MTDNEIILRIRDKDESILSQTYQRYRKEFIRWLGKKYRCPEEDAEEIYQLAFFTFYDQILTGKLTHIVSSIKTYLFGIGKNKFYQHQRQKVRYQELPPEIMGMEDASEEEWQEREMKCLKIEEALKKLGDPCQQILVMKIYENRSMEYITEKLGYKNAATTKNQKYKCQERLKKILEQLTVK